jgi:hypothetical protein
VGSSNAGAQQGKKCQRWPGGGPVAGRRLVAPRGRATRGGLWRARGAQRTRNARLATGWPAVAHRTDGRGTPEEKRGPANPRCGRQLDFDLVWRIEDCRQVSTRPAQRGPPGGAGAAAAGRAGAAPLVGPVDLGTTKDPENRRSIGAGNRPPAHRLGHHASLKIRFNQRLHERSRLNADALPYV